MSNANPNELGAVGDEVWAAKAREAEKTGYLGSEESEAVIQEILNTSAQDQATISRRFKHGGEA